MIFSEMNLHSSLLSALEKEGYSHPTPVQVAAIPIVLSGSDLLACAQTGTGKTAAFALPILHNLCRSSRPGSSATGPRALVLAPTRELALQIEQSFRSYGRNLKLRAAAVFGGVSDQPQKKALARGVDILVATPGRLLDLLAQKALKLDQLEIFVLDEADRMLDMGFIHDIRRIIPFLSRKRQTLMFSATMPGEIRRLADGLLRDPELVQVAPVSAVAEGIDQGVYHVAKSDKPPLLRSLLADGTIARALVFTRTKHGADRVCGALLRNGIQAEAIHGNKSQGARQRSLERFKGGQVRVLVATDIAARGIDVEAVTHVINFDLPEVPETYVHRIGRTARAGATGASVSFCAPEDKLLLGAIESLTRRKMRLLRSNASPAGTASPLHGQGSESGSREPARAAVGISGGPPLAGGQGPERLRRGRGKPPSRRDWDDRRPKSRKNVRYFTNGR